LGDLGIGGLEDWRIGGLEDWKIGGLGDLSNLSEITKFKYSLISINVNQPASHTYFTIYSTQTDG
jgi:hypothetical protein